MSFSYPQQPMPPYGGPGAPGVSPQGWHPVLQPAPPPQPQPAPSLERGDTEGLALLTIAIIFHILLNVYWLHADNHLIHLDEAHHINRAIAYYDALFPVEKTGLFERGVAALGVESPYPPLTHLTGAAFIRMLGYSPDSIAFAGSLFLALFLIGVYLFARQGTNARNAFLAALVAGFMPMAFAGSRYFMPDLLLAALVAWALYALLKSDRFRKTGWVAVFALFTGLAFLTKQTAFVYLLVPALLILGWGAFSAVYPAKGPAVPLRRSRAAHLLFNTLLCLFIVLGVCSWWYTRHVEYMYTWWSTQRGGEVGLLQPGIASHIEFAMPQTLEGAESRIYLDPAISRLTEKPAVEEPAAPEDASVVPSGDSAATPAPEGEAVEALLPKQEIVPAETPVVAEGEGEADLLEGKEGAGIGVVVDTPAAESVLAESEIPESTPTHAASPYALLVAPLQAYWDVYPLFFVNEIAFLPVAILALFGLPALLLKRNRNAMSLLLLVWMSGAYLLLTGMFTLRGPILLFACAPPAAVLCALALDAVPRYRLRRALWGILFFFMALQYINLTLFSYGPLGRAELPVLAEHTAVTDQQNQGLTVYKDQVFLGHYLLHPPQRGETITEVLFEKMLGYEKARENPEGPVAWYQVVSETPAHLSLDFYARHYQQNVRPADEEETAPLRPFAAVKWESRSPEGTLPELAETEYVVLKQGVGQEAVARLEDWAAFFALHDFESIYNCDFDGYGLSLPGQAHLMARREIPSLSNNPDIFQTYELLVQDGARWMLTGDERKNAEQRYARLIQEYTHIQPLNEKVSLLGFHVKSVPENWHVLRLIVLGTDTIVDEPRVWLRATVHPEDRERMLEGQEGQDTLVWDFAPQPAASTWQPNKALVLARPVLAAPLRYKLEIGLCGNGQTSPVAGIVETDWVDFSAEH